MSPVAAYCPDVEFGSTALALLLRTSTAHRSQATGLGHRRNKTACVPAIGLGAAAPTRSFCHSAGTWPPADDTCARDGVPPPRTKTIAPASSQAKPSDPLTCESTSVRGAPPLIGTFSGAGPRTNAIHWPFGDTVRLSAPSVPGMGTAERLSRRLIQSIEPVGPVCAGPWSTMNDPSGAGTGAGASASPVPPAGNCSW